MTSARGKRHALLLAARQLLGAAPGEVGQLHERDRPVHPRLDLVLRHLLQTQAVADVLGDVHVREEPIALEHHVGRALFRPEAGDIGAGDLDRARRRRDEAADHAQERRLPAARRPEHGDEVARIDVEIEGFDGGRGAEDLRETAQAKQGNPAGPVIGARNVAGRGRQAGHGPIEHRRLQH